jgi:hypothetical protein
VISRQKGREMSASAIKPKVGPSAKPGNVKWVRGPYRVRPIGDRFVAKMGPVDPDTGCQPWRGRIASSHGYGTFFADGKLRRAHRFSYELFKGPIPEGMQIDHLCRNCACVAPDHLEAVTQQENLRRGVGREAARARCHEFWGSRPGECRRGHVIDGDNLYVSPDGRRFCRTCIRERGNTARDRRREGLPPSPRGTGPRKLTDEQVAQIRKMRAEGVPYRQVALTFGISMHTVWQVCKNKTWKQGGKS